MDKGKVATSGGVAVAISAGLQAAVLAGVAIPVWGQFAGAIFGAIVYKLLPNKDKVIVDNVVDKAIDVATTIPHIYADYGVAQQSPLEPMGNTKVVSVTNLKSGGE